MSHRNRDRENGRPNVVTPLECVTPQADTCKVVESASDEKCLDEICLGDAAVVDNIITPDDGHWVELDFGETPNPNHHPESYHQRFQRMAQEGSELLISLMAWMCAGRTYNALRLIGNGYNCHLLARALAVVFFNCEVISLGSKTKKGYDLLRYMVATCVADLQQEGRDLPRNYDILAHRLFVSKGHPMP